MSRRSADQAVGDGRVKINGTTATLGDQVSAEDKISLDGKDIKRKTKTPIILVYNKPIGVECTSNPSVKNNIIDAVNFPSRLVHVGRLDKNSEGLILLTNIGEVGNNLLGAKYGHEKEYIVQTDRSISNEQLVTLSKGVRLEDGYTSPCKIKRMSSKRFSIVLTEGRNRQIRRMIRHVGLVVVNLKRVRILDLKLGDLPIGKYRMLNSKECGHFLSKLGLSSIEGTAQIGKSLRYLDK